MVVPLNSRLESNKEEKITDIRRGATRMKGSLAYGIGYSKPYGSYKISGPAAYGRQHRRLDNLTVG